MNTRLVAFGILVLLIGQRASAAEEPTKPNAKQLEFFESRIRPVLVKQCYSCHSKQAKSVKGGLLLDTRAGIRKGGESGPSVVPNDPKKSLLLEAIRYESFEMPPKQRLPKSVVADFETWIKSGAADPRDGEAGLIEKPRIDIAKARQSWTFQRPKPHAPPKVQTTTWPQTDIDRFILAALEKEGLSPVNDADKRTLIRRVTYDLIGLPPSPAEIHAFLKDSSPNAFEKVVDRLLASPHFGERWGRHWLDVARYADSNGGDINLTFPNAWRYRDYVINAFNNDKAFDQFIVEQLAGDLLPYKSDAQRTEQLIGSGFLVIGSKMLSERDKEKLRMDTVDDQLDTIGRAFLGLTLGCARCHDHKFDPVPTKDYYALAGIFRSTTTVQGIRMNNVNVSGWIERELPDSPENLKARADYDRRMKSLNNQIASLKKQLGGGKSKTIVAVNQLPGIVVDDVDAKLVGLWKASTYTPRYVGAGYVHDEKMDKGNKSITFTPKLPAAGEYEVRLSFAGGGGRDRKVPVTVRHAGGESRVLLDQSTTPNINGLFRSIGKFRFEAGTKGSVRISTEGTTEFVIADAVQFLPVGKTRIAKTSNENAAKTPNAKTQKLTRELQQLEKQLAALKKSAPPKAPLCMAPRDIAEPDDCKLRIRGEPHNFGPEVPRGFLTVVDSGTPPGITEKTSGRLELARWIANDRNPLTARVTMNRVWHHLFGSGIVRSVDNFGKLGDKPSHPELLDRLATDFMKDGWSIKRAIRRIVLSRTYQLSSSHSDRGMAADPQNRSLWRQNRRRLSAEAIRDALLVVAGQLNRESGGSSVENYGEQAVANNLRDKGGGDTSGTRGRRSIYLPMVRNDLPEFLTVFDFADPNVVVGARSVTTVPAQALLMMNSDFVKQRATHLATRVLKEKSLTDTEKLNRLYELTLGRLPTEKERYRALEFLNNFDPKSTDPSAKAWTAFSHALLASTEFRFVE